MVAFYRVKCECGLGFILRLRGIVRFHPPFERYREISSSVWTVSWGFVLRLRGILRVHPPFVRYREGSSSVWEVSWGFILRLRGIVRFYPPFERYRVLSAARTVHDTSQTEDETLGTFTLNCINATRVYPGYSPWRWPSRVETCRRLLRLRLCIFECISWCLLFRMIQCTDMEHIKARECIECLWCQDTQGRKHYNWRRKKWHEYRIRQQTKKQHTRVTEGNIVRSAD
jgi:hypothetical protein